MKSGNQRSSLAARRAASSVGGYRMNHCRLVTISSGRLPFSQNFTGWVIGLRFADHVARLGEQLDDRGSAPASRSSGDRRTMRPFVGRRPAAGVWTMRPSRPTIDRTGSPSSRHQMTSVVSPNVQIIAMPEPFSGSASSWATTGTSTPNKRRSRQCCRTAAGSARRRGGRRARRTRRASSGRVVSM